MTTTPTSTDMPDIRAVLDAIRWAGDRFSSALSYPRGSAERSAAAEELRTAVDEARALLDRYPGKIALMSRVILTAAELGLRRLARIP